MKRSNLVKLMAFGVFTASVLSDPVVEASVNILHTDNYQSIIINSSDTYDITTNRNEVLGPRPALKVDGTNINAKAILHSNGMINWFNLSTGTDNYIGISNETVGNKVVFSGERLRLIGTGTGPNLDSQYRAILNNGLLVFDNDVDLEIIGAGGIKNNGLLTFNKRFTLIRFDDGVTPEGELRIMNEANGTLTINSDFMIGAYDSRFVMDNKGKIDIACDNTAGNYILGGTIIHNSGAMTNIVLKGSDTSWAYVDSKIKGSNYGGFNLDLKEGSVWNVSFNQDEAVKGVQLNGGRIEAPVGLNGSTLVYKTLSLIDFYSNGRFSDGNYSKASGFIVFTDLAKDQGNKVEFLGATPNTTVPFIIRNANDNNGVNIKPSDGHSVTIASAPNDTPMVIKVDKMYAPSFGYGEGLKVYKPIVETKEVGSIKNWNFVGWRETEETKLLAKEIDQHKDSIKLNETDMDNTLKRINDIRTDPSEVGVWLRGESGKMKIRSYSYDYNLMSGGYDWDFDSNAAKMFLGFGISYAKNDCDTGIIGNTKSMGYNLYGSWLGKENKDYVDVIIKYGTLDKDYAGFDDNNVFVTGDYDKNLFSIAAKYGRRIDREDGWYFEPSVGLTWGRIGSADYTDSQGIKIHADSSTSKMASLGVQVGKNVKGTEYYGKFEVRHDFDGKMHVSVPGSNLPGSSVYDDMGGTWYKVGIGAARKIDKNNSFYIDIEKDFGNKVKKPYSIGAGYRYTW